MSHTHLVKRIDTLDDNTKMVHFNDDTRSLRVTKTDDNLYQTTSPTGNTKSRSVNALIKQHVTTKNKQEDKQKPVNEEANSIHTGDEVIISKGEYKGKHGFVSKVQNPEGDKHYHIKNNSHESYGHFSEDEFFHKHITEEANGVGGGAIAGVGVGDQGEPGVRRPNTDIADLVLTALMKRRKMNEKVT